MGVCWRQNEHPMSNRVPWGEDESGGVAQEVCQDQVSRKEPRQDEEELPVVSSKPTGLAPSQEPSGESKLAPAREPDKGGERSQLREPSQEDVCQAEEE